MNLKKKVAELRRDLEELENILIFFEQSNEAILAQQTNQDFNRFLVGKSILYDQVTKLINKIDTKLLDFLS